MTHGLVYLAGPVTGQDFTDARFGWRGDAMEFFHVHDITGISPLRHLSEDQIQLDDHNLIPASGLEDQMASDDGITGRCRFDVQRCDVMIANFLPGPIKASLGTAVEFGWASQLGTPIIMVRQDDNVHNHAILNSLADYQVETLEEALSIVRHMLVPGL